MIATVHKIRNDPEAELRDMVIRRDELLREAAQVEQEMMPLRRQYADARGERLLPSIERLRREMGDAADAAALRPSGLSRDASQAKPAAAIAGRA